jgi:1-deoxy-D-xylulose-5-phosphate reductoisomerase
VALALERIAGQRDPARRAGDGGGTGLDSVRPQPPDRERFPGLYLAWDALRAPAGTTAILNAANEMAVDAFLSGTIGFTAIHSVNARTLDRLQPRLGDSHTLDDLLELDRQARATARQVMKDLGA